MPKVLAVFGATGIQGSSVINYIRNDAVLSKAFTIRAITRDTNSDAAKKLRQETVEVVHGDFTDRVSLEGALAGVDTVFAMTLPVFGQDVQDSFNQEYSAGKSIADASIAQGVKYIIFSTLPSPKEISGGKYNNVHHFDSKAAIEQYIRGLDIKSAFFSPGAFMSNYTLYPFFSPQKDESVVDTWVLPGSISPDALMPHIDAIRDTGKFIGAILSEPERYEGKTFCASTALYSLTEIASTMAAVTGKNVIYRQVDIAEFGKTFPGNKDTFAEIFQYATEFGGYYGSETKQLVAWAVENARGTPSTFKEYLQSSQFTLK